MPESARALKSITIDPWSYFDYKPSFDRQQMNIIPSWVGEHWRRLQAYKVLESYYRNNSREWRTAPEDLKQKLREYGDPGTIRDTVLASLLGDDISIMVEGAESDVADENDEVSQVVLQKLLEWRKKERLDQKIIENERSSVGLGDGVYVLVWDDKKRRPRLQVYDPGFYFPVLQANVVDEYPETIHVAWEYEAKWMDGKVRRFVRRLTWYLGGIEPHDEEGLPLNEADPEFEERFVLFDNEELNEDGYILRQYPWNEDPSEMTCFFMDRTWLLSSDIDTNFLEELAPDKAVFGFGPVDLQLDFLPVVHVPNTVADKEHFGMSVIARVMQVLDDMVNTDTDLQASSATTGSPPIAVGGSTLPRKEDGTVASYGPGTVWETGEGTATMIDTSRSLDALLKYADALASRLAVNSRVPESLLGKVKPNEVPSGIALTLSFTSHSQLIKEMRLVRADKYSLLLKFVTRMYWYNGLLDLPDGDDAPYANVVFGSFLPADRQEAANLVSTLLGTTPPAISLETAVRMLVNAGFPIDDAVEEVRRIIESDFESANKLLEATGNVQAVYDRLGLGTAPTIDLPEETVEDEEPPENAP